MPVAYKIPESVLVVIYTPSLDVLLIKRADAVDYWQSVTGSKDALEEPYLQTAFREVHEETGIACGPGAPLHAGLYDWGLENVYDIYPHWQWRYGPGVTRNTEHLFGLRVPSGMPICLNPQEHTAYQWLPYREAAQKCSSASNAEAVLLLTHLALSSESA